MNYIYYEVRLGDASGKLTTWLHRWKKMADSTFYEISFDLILLDIRNMMG